jgi:hypothetical protein
LGGPPPPFSGSPEAGVCGPPFPLVIDRLRTALAPRSLKRHLDLHRAANGGAAHHRHLPLLPSATFAAARADRAAEAPLPASVTKRVETYNHQLGAVDWAFTRNHPQLCQSSICPLQVRHAGMAPANPLNTDTPRVCHTPWRPSGSLGSTASWLRHIGAIRTLAPSSHREGTPNRAIRPDPAGQCGPQAGVSPLRRGCNAAVTRQLT